MRTLVYAAREQGYVRNQSWTLKKSSHKMCVLLYESMALTSLLLLLISFILFHYLIIFMERACVETLGVGVRVPVRIRIWYFGFSGISV